MIDSEKSSCGVVHLVVDSAGFLKNAPLKDLGDKLYTIEEVVAEIRDKATRERLQVLPYDLHYKRPTVEAIKFVTDFSKKTGDYATLSAVDLKVLALTYQLEKEFVGTEHIKNEPTKNVTTKPANHIEPLPMGFYTDKKMSSAKKVTKEEIQSEEKVESADDVGHDSGENNGEIIEDVGGNNDEVSTNDKDSGNEDGNEEDVDEGDNDIGDDENNQGGDEDNENGNNEDNENGDEDKEEEDEKNKDKDDEDEENDDDDDDDDGGWITPSNINKFNKTNVNQPVGVEEQATVACLTADFAMQNVLIQMGLKVVSVDGLLIKHAKCYVLKCYGCFKVTKDTAKQFCPHCGNRTLKKVSYSVNEDGTMTYYMAKEKKTTTRGLKYSIPMPKGGKYHQDPILCEDQLKPHQRASNRSKAKVDVFDPDYVVRDSPFIVNDITSRAAMLGFNRKTGQGAVGSRRNPNENKKKLGKKK